MGVKTDIKQTFDTKTFPIESYTDGDYNKKVVCVIVVLLGVNTLHLGLANTTYDFNEVCVYLYEDVTAWCCVRKCS